jgi:hypothetical protein
MATTADSSFVTFLAVRILIQHGFPNQLLTLAERMLGCCPCRVPTGISSTFKYNAQGIRLPRVNIFIYPCTKKNVSDSWKIVSEKSCGKISPLPFSAMVVSVISNTAWNLRYGLEILELISILIYWRQHDNTTVGFEF